MIHYRKHFKNSDSEWVLFVHGAGGSSSLWFKQVKEFRKEFNLLIVDLRGHGKSGSFLEGCYNNKFTMDDVTHDLVEVLDKEKIEKAHFVGLSLGSVVIKNLADSNPDRIASMTLGGAVTRFTFSSQLLLRVSNFLKMLIPFQLLYKVMAFVVMPRKSNKESRSLFVRDAKKLGRQEFMRWFKIISEANPLLKFLNEKDVAVPTLYVMGELDYLFLEPVKKLVKAHKTAELEILPGCGHVCNVEAPELFNELTIKFIKNNI